MDLTAPTSLSDVIADGALVQAGVDEAWRREFGQVTGVEFSGDEVRVHRRDQAAVDLPGRQVAVIRGGEWTWEPAWPGVPDIAELHGSHPADDRLVAAARTLHGNVPVLLAPSGDVTRVIAVGFRPSAGPVRESLIAGLAGISPEVDLERALLGFAASRGLGIRREGDAVSFSDGTALTLVDGRVTHVSGGLSLAQVRADARYLSFEHQLLLVGRFPDAIVRVNIGRGTAMVADRVQATAVIIATITGDSWTWAWADPHLPPTAAANLRRFGLDQGIPELFRPSVPVDRARHLALEEVAKPVLGIWTHAVTRLNDTTSAVVLLDAPELHLPAPTEETVAATLQAPLDPALDRDRALAAYRSRRGITTG